MCRARLGFGMWGQVSGSGLGWHFDMGVKVRVIFLFEASVQGWVTLQDDTQNPSSGFQDVFQV